MRATQRRRQPGEERPREDGNAAVALLLGPALVVLCMAFWSVGAGQWSEAVAWFVVLIVLCRWLSRAER